MIDEAAKKAYRSVQPPEELKGRVLSACAAARKRRSAARKRRLASVAACLAVLVGVAGYGLSPVPQISSGGASMENGLLCMAETSILVEEAQNGVRMLSGEEMLDGCVTFSVDRDSSVKVSAGMLYSVDAATGTAQMLGTTVRVSAGTELCWRCEEENAVLTLRSGLRSVALRLNDAEGQWWLCR